MKKIYETPLTVEVKVNLEAHLMEGSPLERYEQNATVNGDDNYEYSLSRGGSSAWGDEE